MSPSHLGYYFENKAAILEGLAAAICRANLAGLPEFAGSTANLWIERLADFCFGPGNTSTAVLGVIQELTGLAAQDARLRKIKTRHTTAWRKYLETGFSYWPLRAELSSRRAAWHAHALIVGFTTNFTLLNEGNEMKFGIFYEHQLPRPWHERSEFDLIQNSLDQIELAVK
jgi:hypothetical protein